jgi:hypothetical protein
MTASVADARGHVIRLILVVKMATVLKECNTEEQKSVVLFFGGQKIQCKGNVSCLRWGVSCKAIHNWVEKHDKRFADDEGVETEMRKLLRQQSKDLNAAGFDTLVKRWDKCISVGGGYVEK